MRAPDVALLLSALEAMIAWPRADDGVALHPGDLAWAWQRGADRLAAHTRYWERNGRVVALGMLDGPEVFRLGMDPTFTQDPLLAQEIADDLSDPLSGPLRLPSASLEARSAIALRSLLAARGWSEGEAWAPLVLDLAGEVELPASLRVEAVSVDDEVAVEARVSVQAAGFEGSTFDAARWRRMAEGPGYAHGRCLLGRDDDGRAVAMCTVWDAGPGRPGLIEPLAVHRDARGRGHGRAITLAAAAALRERGADSVVVCTPATNAAGVSAYRSAGFTRLPDSFDLVRPLTS